MHLPGAHLILRRRPAPPVSHAPSRAVTQQWHYRPPEGPPPPRRVPIPGSCPLAYQLEDRRDCVNCGGLWPALVRADGFQCQHCHLITLT